MEGGNFYIYIVSFGKQLSFLIHISPLFFLKIKSDKKTKKNKKINRKIKRLNNNQKRKERGGI